MYHSSTGMPQERQIRHRRACIPVCSALYISVSFIVIKFSSTLNLWMLLTQSVIYKDTSWFCAGSSSRLASANRSRYASLGYEGHHYNALNLSAPCYLVHWRKVTQYNWTINAQTMPMSNLTNLDIDNVVCFDWCFEILKLLLRVRCLSNELQLRSDNPKRPILFNNSARWPATPTHPCTTLSLRGLVSEWFEYRLNSIQTNCLFQLAKPVSENSIMQTGFHQQWSLKRQNHESSSYGMTASKSTINCQSKASFQSPAIESKHNHFKFSAP